MKVFLFYLSLFFVVALAACNGGEAQRSSASQSVSDSAPVAAMPAESLPKIVAFGDSLTAGYGLPAHESYPSLLQEQLAKDGYQYEVINAGVSGDTTAGGLRRIDWALAQGDVRFVILELGANDLLRGQSVAAMKKNLAQMIERAQARGAQVVLAGMYAPTNTGAAYQKEVAEAFQSLAREHGVTLIPFFLDRVAGVENLNLEDGIHPNTEGTRIVAETVYQALKPKLDESGRE
ncbi:MAG: arylesterase [Acidobacteriota bacterium]|nr:arylesterase [Acidobacteriota bacterium]